MNMDFCDDCYGISLELGSVGSLERIKTEIRVRSID